MTEKMFFKLDLKEVSDEGEFEGYASKFDVVDRGGDIVQKGAFTQSLRDRGAEAVKMLWQHNSGEPIGTWTSIKQDSVGLFVKGRLLTEVQKAKETYVLMKGGVLDGLSIGYRTVKSTSNEFGQRLLKEIELWEISVVTFPMQDGANITGVKGDWTKTDVQKVLRNAGMANAMATKLVANGFDAANTLSGQRNADTELSSFADELRRLNKTMERT